MLRTYAAAALAVLCLAILGCRDAEGNGPSGPGELSGTLKEGCPEPALGLIEALFPGGLETASSAQCANLKRQFDRGEVEDALAKLGELLRFALGHFHNGRLEDTQESLGMSTEEALAELILALYAIVGHSGPEELAAAFGEGGAVVVCHQGETCRVVGSDGFSGYLIGPETQFLVDGVSFDGPVTFFIAPLSSSESPFQPHGFPLGEGSFPLFRFFGSVPDGIVLSPAIPGAVCVVDPPHPDAPEPDQLPNLRLAHLVDGGVEALPLADPGDLVDCTGVNAVAQGPAAGLERYALVFLRPAGRLLTPASLFAAPGKLGGAITAFSPFGAIDPTFEEEPSEEGGPTTTTLTIDDNSLVHGQTTTATATVSPAPGNALQGEVRFEIAPGTVNQQLVTRTLVDGEATITIQCDALGQIASEADAEIGSGSFFIRARFLGAGDFETSVSGSQIISCQAPIG